MHICNNTMAKYIIIKYKNILINAISNTNNTNIIIPYTTSRQVPDGVSGTRRRVGYPTTPSGTGHPALYRILLSCIYVIILGQNILL